MSETFVLSSGVGKVMDLQVAVNAQLLKLFTLQGSHMASGTAIAQPFNKSKDGFVCAIVSEPRLVNGPIKSKHQEYDLAFHFHYLYLINLC